MKVAVVGCLHGELDAVYATLAHIERTQGVRVALLLVCGDFQALRGPADLPSLAAPRHHRRVGDFARYFSGAATAPLPTLLVGGNHEASAHLWARYHGGFLAENVYYVGHSGVVRFGALRVAGCGGIFKAYDHRRPYAAPPPQASDVCRMERWARGAHHTRSFEAFRLRQLRRNVDVMLTHDWPRGAAALGDSARLFRAKPFLAAERDTLGSPVHAELQRLLKPRFWFAAHMHVRHAAVYPAELGGTRFLALDKVLPGRDFLQIVEIPATTEAAASDGENPRLMYDPEWLCIVHRTASLFPLADFEDLDKCLVDLPPAESFPPVSDADIEAVRAAGAGIPGVGRELFVPGFAEQTDTSFVELLQRLCGSFPIVHRDPPADAAVTNPEEIDLGDDRESQCSTGAVVANPEEIDLE